MKIPVIAVSVVRSPVSRNKKGSLGNNLRVDSTQTLTCALEPSLPVSHFPSVAIQMKWHHYRQGRETQQRTQRIATNKIDHEQRRCYVTGQSIYQKQQTRHFMCTRQTNYGRASTCSDPANTRTRSRLYTWRSKNNERRLRRRRMAVVRAGGYCP